jgi:methionyl-tRNA formyltransferase
MTPNSAWRCVLIGGESLLIQCAQSLLDAGHQVAALCTRSAAARAWAISRSVRVLDDAQGLLTAADLGPIDYLFSVTHLQVIPAEVLRLARRAAINFHDGPLPEYAGLNTPVWALLAREPRHGVTWHLMTDQVDRGDLLVERRFDLADDESALTLNAKCYGAAAEAFETLLTGLADGSLQPRAQTGTGRTFARRDRPAAAGLLRWDRPAHTPIPSARPRWFTQAARWSCSRRCPWSARASGCPVWCEV